MAGLLRYQIINYIRTYRYVPPLTIYIISLVVNYTFTPNPILDSYSITSITLFFLMGWFTVTIFHAEDEGQKQITLLHSGRKGDYHLTLFIICISFGFFLSVVSVFYPIIFDAFGGKTRPLHIILGLLSHFSLSILSISLTAIFTRDIIKGMRNTWWGVLSILTISLAISSIKEMILPVKWIVILLPPVHLALEIMSSKDSIKFIPTSYFWQFSWIFLYSFIIIGLYFLIVYCKRSR